LISVILQLDCKIKEYTSETSKSGGELEMTIDTCTSEIEIKSATTLNESRRLNILARNPCEALRRLLLTLHTDIPSLTVTAVAQCLFSLNGVDGGECSRSTLGLGIISVPGSSGANVFLIRIGIFAAIA
jgi:hypothetical protein